jgi:hypothetical protein
MSPVNEFFDNGLVGDKIDLVVHHQDVPAGLDPVDHLG